MEELLNGKRAVQIKNGKNKSMKPITAVVKQKGGARTYPANQEVTLNADGGGGPILLSLIHI